MMDEPIKWLRIHERLCFFVPFRPEFVRVVVAEYLARIPFIRIRHGLDITQVSYSPKRISSP